MKKHFPLLLGLSLLTGLAGTIFWHKNKRQPSAFIGSWFYQTPLEEVHFTINEDWQLTKNSKPIKTTLVELTPERLILLDEMGYTLTFLLKDGRLHFYDETEIDSSCHILMAQTQNKEQQEHSSSLIG
ncbi:DUF4828 domain-containing protein [Enterococcus saigonensis]|uniref:DUF4828 domain-containing protein n=1 Tax=Enterococcus saigonensis TaxID=1805431 RepID=A0A679IBE4_9ENTE|nr:DUF4828 domain-containing protein [Enterococcus saigonensis]BCA85409.1 DUF4828 domain-containing protein [Enterococcus saigonensis]